MNISEAVGRIHATKRDSIVTPRRRGSMPAVVFCHGYGGDATQAIGYANPGSHEIMAAIAKTLGMSIVATTHNDGFGNAVSKTQAVDDAVAYARANLRANNNPFCIIGASAGVTLALNYAADYPERVACLVGLIPLLDAQAIRDADTVVGGVHLRGALDTAHGVVYPVALPVNTDPAKRTAALAAVPQQLWYASDDAVSVNLQAYGAAVHAELHSVGALGHTPAAITAVDESAVVEFIRKHIGG